MKISLINGSQKTGESNSGIILGRLLDLVKEKHEAKMYRPGVKLFSDETFAEIASGDAIVLAFPLFVDAIPSRTLEMLIELESAIKRRNAGNLIMYTIINNGFYEGKQNHVAFEIIEHWCEHSGVRFGGGIGQGAGEMIGLTKRYPINKGPFNNLDRALQAMIVKMEMKEPAGITYLSPYFPRFLWRWSGVRYWNSCARGNGLKKKDILRRL